MDESIVLKNNIDGIIEDKKLQEELRNSRENYQELAESIFDVFFAMDKDLRYIYWNKASETLTGISSKDAIGKTIFDIFPDNEETRSAAAAYQKVIKTQHPQTFISEYHLGGKVYFFEIHVYPSRSGISVFVKDITEHKRAEEALRESEVRYRALFASAAEGIAAADLETKQFCHVNPAMCRMFGYTEEELIRLGVADIHPKESLGHVQAEFEAQVRCEKTLVDDLPCLRKDGATFYANVNATLIVLDGHKCLMGFFTDVTEHKKAKETLKQEKEKTEKLLVELENAHKKLKSAQNVLLRREKIATTGVLAAGVAHEIRNPLAIIGMTIQYLQTRLGENDPRRELTEAIIKKVDRLDRVTKELSSYGRTMSLNIKRHNLARCLRLSLSLIKPKCRIQRIKIRKRYTKLPLIEMDDEQMDKVFLNIMDNALQAMPNGGTLTISTDFDEKENAAIIRFHNTGPLIKKKHLPHIFQPFYTVKKKEGGTGLGLAIVQNAVLRHNGQILVENKRSGKDKGVAFIIRLPVSASHIQRERESKFDI